MKAIVILIVTLFLVGCAPTLLRHPTKASIDQDKYECAIIAEQRAMAWSGRGGLNPILFRDFTVQCLERRGWVKVRQ